MSAVNNSSDLKRRKSSGKQQMKPKSKESSFSGQRLMAKSEQLKITTEIEPDDPKNPMNRRYFHLSLDKLSNAFQK